MKEALRGIWNVIVCVSVMFGLVCLTTHILSAHKAVISDPYGEVELLARTDSGVKVWRVNHEKALVPVLIVEGRDGQIAIR